MESLSSFRQYCNIYNWTSITTGVCENNILDNLPNKFDGYNVRVKIQCFSKQNASETYYTVITMTKILIYLVLHHFMAIALKNSTCTGSNTAMLG